MFVVIQLERPHINMNMTSRVQQIEKYQSEIKVLHISTEPERQGTLNMFQLWCGSILHAAAKSYVMSP